jgi:hypothetical protein
MKKKSKDFCQTKYVKYVEFVDFFIFELDIVNVLELNYDSIRNLNLYNSKLLRS